MTQPGSNLHFSGEQTEVVRRQYYVVETFGGHFDSPKLGYFDFPISPQHLVPLVLVVFPPLSQPSEAVLCLAAVGLSPVVSVPSLFVAAGNFVQYDSSLVEDDHSPSEHYLSVAVGCLSPFEFALFLVGLCPEDDPFLDPSLAVAVVAVVLAVVSIYLYHHHILVGTTH